MDFENMGTMIGARAAIDDVAARARAMSDAKDAEIARLKATLAVEIAHAAGLNASLDAMKAAMARVSPSEPLLAATGRVFTDGSKETRLSLVYAKAFDLAAKAKGLMNPERLRSQYR
ncbi:hypothetical protein [Bosea sp. RAC05]|uniref:hypothetical protein n=1 Tax=Bosea sp. RAC05 TaxID=1842539 RepID=UPI00083D333F|nr:hypothetical protein [Bosea sp. RAC05]